MSPPYYSYPDLGRPTYLRWKGHLDRPPVLWSELRSQVDGSGY